MKKDRRLLILIPVLIITLVIAVQCGLELSSEENFTNEMTRSRLFKKNSIRSKDIEKESNNNKDKINFYKLQNDIFSRDLLPINKDIRKIQNDLINLKPCQILDKYKNSGDDNNEWRTLGNYYQGSDNADLSNPRRIIYEKNLGADLYDSLLNDINDFQTVELISIDFPLLNASSFINDSHSSKEVDQINDLINNRNTALKNNAFDKLSDSFNDIDQNLYSFLVMINNYNKIKKYVDEQSLYEKIESYFENNSSNNQLRYAFESKKTDYLKMANTPSEIALAINLYQKSKSINYQVFLKIARLLKSNNKKAFENFNTFINNEVTYFLLSPNYHDLPLEYFNVLKVFDQRIKDMRYEEFIESKNMYLDPIYGKGCDDRGLKDLCDKYCSGST